VKRIIYLGGLGLKDTASKHLRSRLETGEILSSRPTGSDDLARAGIIGSGSDFSHHSLSEAARDDPPYGSDADRANRCLDVTDISSRPKTFRSRAASSRHRLGNTFGTCFSRSRRHGSGGSSFSAASQSRLHPTGSADDAVPYPIPKPDPRMKSEPRSRMRTLEVFPRDHPLL
jgi:hypothetical protein